MTEETEKRESTPETRRIRMDPSTREKQGMRATNRPKTDQKEAPRMPDEQTMAAVTATVKPQEIVQQHPPRVRASLLELKNMLTRLDNQKQEN